MSVASVSVAPAAVSSVMSIRTVFSAILTFSCLVAAVFPNVRMDILALTNDAHYVFRPALHVSTAQTMVA